MRTLGPKVFILHSQFHCIQFCYIDSSKAFTNLNQSILHCFIYLWNDFWLQCYVKWTLVDHSLNQLIVKSISSTLFQKLSLCYMITSGYTPGDYVTFLGFLKQRRTSNLNNNPYLFCVKDILLMEMLSHNNFILYDVYRAAGDNSDRPNVKST